MNYLLLLTLRGHPQKLRTTADRFSAPAFRNISRYTAHFAAACYGDSHSMHLTCYLPTRLPLTHSLLCHAFPNLIF
jgi:hypothetical protein